MASNKNEMRKRVNQMEGEILQKAFRAKGDDQLDGSCAAGPSWAGAGLQRSIVIDIFRVYFYEFNLKLSSTCC